MSERFVPAKVLCFRFLSVGAGQGLSGVSEVKAGLTMESGRWHLSLEVFAMLGNNLGVFFPASRFSWETPPPAKRGRAFELFVTNSLHWDFQSLLAVLGA